MAKQVQIDMELFLDLYDFFFSESAPDGVLADEIRKAINDKVDKMISRELFTKYKRSPSGSEREAARKEYLDHRNIPYSWRSDSEIHDL